MRNLYLLSFLAPLLCAIGVTGLEKRDLEFSSIVLKWEGAPHCIEDNCTNAFNSTPRDYACSNGIGEWDDGQKTFNDPIPLGNILRAINISLIGKFFCDAAEPLTSFLSTMNNLVTSADRSESQDGCDCDVCWTYFGLSAWELNEDFYLQYHYNSTNTFRLALITNNMCVSSANLTFFYAPVNITEAEPLTGPLQGGTSVRLLGSGLWNNVTISLWQCRFGSLSVPVPAQYISDFELSCETPAMKEPGSVPIEVTGNGKYFITTKFEFVYKQDKNDSKRMNLLKIAQDFWWAILVGALIILALFVLIILNYRQQHKRNKALYQPLLSTSFGSYGSNDSIALGEVVLGERIGRGNFGEVFKGFWNGTVVAVKQTKLPGMANEEETNQLFEDFEREARIMKSLRHPNVLQFLGICRVNDGADICIIMEFMPRGSLYRILHNESIDLSWELRLRMAVDVSKGMNYLHKLNPIIIHRDLKSHNLLLDENFKVKISDFGLARLISNVSQASMTSCGTPAWTAPEVLRNERYTESADVFGFGIVLWELLTRDEPHRGIPPFQVIFAVGTQGSRPQIPSSSPSDYSRLIDDCWAERPTDRPDFDEIIRRLEAML